MKSKIEAICRHYIAELEGSGAENALHSLMGLSIESLPILMDLYRTQESDDKRRNIIHAIWQHRDENALDFLLNVLVNEKHEPIWQEALDGVITLEARNELLQLKITEPSKSNSIKAVELIGQCTESGLAFRLYTKS